MLQKLYRRFWKKLFLYYCVGGTGDWTWSCTCWACPLITELCSLVPWKKVLLYFHQNYVIMTPNSPAVNLGRYFKILLFWGFGTFGLWPILLLLQLLDVRLTCCYDANSSKLRIEIIWTFFSSEFLLEAPVEGIRFVNVSTSWTRTTFSVCSNA